MLGEVMSDFNSSQPLRSIPKANLRKIAETAYGRVCRKAMSVCSAVEVRPGFAAGRAAAAGVDQDTLEPLVVDKGAALDMLAGLNEQVEEAQKADAKEAAAAQKEGEKEGEEQQPKEEL